MISMFFFINFLGKIVGDVLVHDHPSNAAAVKAKILKEKIKKKSSKSQEKPATIVSTSLQGVLSPVAALLPKPISLSRAVQRSCVKTVAPIMNPDSRSELLLTDEYKFTYSGDLFLLHDSGNDKNRFLVFTSLKNLNYLVTCHLWLSDGTFKSVPSIFSQLYTIHGYKDGKSLPLVYMLAPDKSKSLYLKFLKVLRNAIPNFSPDRLMMDFEIGFIEAFKQVFHGAKVSGCNFHFCQSVWRHIQFCGLETRYNTDIEFSRNIRMLMALAFVPPEDVTAAFDKLMSTDYYDRNSDILEDIVAYFEST